jgi:endonuclease/exonuclease/phosphatase family metal-dependent hydrolase
VKNSRPAISIISFNAMSAFNFNTIKGFMLSMDIVRRLPETIKILKQQNAEIIALQEIHTYLVLNFFKKKLSEYPYIAYKKYLYGPRGGLVIFSKTPLSDIKYFDFKKRGAYTNSSFVAHLIKNGVLSCRIDSQHLYLLNTHLTPNLDFNWTEKNRFYNYINAQLHQITELVKQVVNDGNKVIIAGDFNTSKDSMLYKRFLSNTNLIDVFAECDFPTLHQDYLAKNKAARRIDYIFLTDGKVIKKDHLFTKRVILGNGKLRYLSDHIGLRADLHV